MGSCVGAMTKRDQTYTWPLSNGIQPGNMVRLKGTVPKAGKNFNINFQSQNDYNASDIILHVSVRFGEGVIVLNTKDSGKWLSEVRANTLAIAAGREFEIVIAVESNQFRIAVNGNHFADFTMRRSHTHIRALSVIGDVSVTAVSFESSRPGPGHKPTGFGTPYPFPR